MKVRIKRVHEKAVMPQYAKPGDACFDLVSVESTSGINPVNKEMIRQPVYIEHDTGLAFEIPEGHVGLVFPRSSVSNSTSFLANSVGVIDSFYRGTIKLRFREGFIGKQYKVGDKIGQMMVIPIPRVELEETDELSKTERGEGGFGSTGS
jgi:dUTP pyrophosphatase